MVEKASSDCLGINVVEGRQALAASNKRWSSGVILMLQFAGKMTPANKGKRCEFKWPLSPKFGISCPSVACQLPVESVQRDHSRHEGFLDRDAVAGQRGFRRNLGGSTTRLHWFPAFLYEEIKEAQGRQEGRRRWLRLRLTWPSRWQRFHWLPSMKTAKADCGSPGLIVGYAFRE